MCGNLTKVLLHKIKREYFYRNRLLHHNFLVNLFRGKINKLHIEIGRTP